MNTLGSRHFLEARQLVQPALWWDPCTAGSCQYGVIGSFRYIPAKPQAIATGSSTPWCLDNLHLTALQHTDLLF